MHLNKDEEDYSTPNLSLSYKKEFFDDTSENVLSILRKSVTSFLSP